MNWTDTFIDNILEQVPQGRYRRRTGAELHDHLETQCRALMDAGRTEDEARAETLRLMGEPEKLQEEYEAAWRRRPEAWVRAGLGWLGAVMIGCVLLYAAFGLTLFLLAMFKESRDYTGAAYQFLAGILTFCVPFAAVAVFLRLCLRNYRHRGVLISAGLLAIWTLGTMLLVMFVLAIGEYEQYGLLPPTWPERLALFYRDMRHTNTPWITPGYHLMNIAGCGFLGWLFRRRFARGALTEAGPKPGPYTQQN